MANPDYIYGIPKQTKGEGYILLVILLVNFLFLLFAIVSHFMPHTTEQPATTQEYQQEYQQQYPDYLDY